MFIAAGRQYSSQSQSVAHRGPQPGFCSFEQLVLDPAKDLLAFFLTTAGFGLCCCSRSFGCSISEVREDASAGNRDTGSIFSMSLRVCIALSLVYVAVLKLSSWRKEASPAEGTGS